MVENDVFGKYILIFHQKKRASGLLTGENFNLPYDFDVDRGPVA